jgi:threonine/homoserine/homoserine lactone efflux protein
MYTALFFILAVASGLVAWWRDSLTAQVLFILFAVLYLISLAFDVCARREERLEEEEEDEEDFRAHLHYFD